jgi:long-chain acyl-CoA synthetase
MGYVNDAADGLQIRSGWLYSGDEGRQNDDGTVTFLGIRKPMFTRNGFNIYPRELERVIGGMAGVADVRVSGIPEPAREIDIRVDVWGAITEAEVKAWCESQLGAYKQPAVIEVHASVPQHPHPAAQP